METRPRGFCSLREIKTRNRSDRIECQSLSRIVGQTHHKTGKKSRPFAQKMQGAVWCDWWGQWWCWMGRDPGQSLVQLLPPGRRCASLTRRTSTFRNSFHPRAITISSFYYKSQLLLSCVFIEYAPFKGRCCNLFLFTFSAVWNVHALYRAGVGKLFGSGATLTFKC